MATAGGPSHTVEAFGEMSNLDEVLLKLTDELSETDAEVFHGDVEVLQEQISELCGRALNRFCGELEGTMAGELLRVSVNQIDLDSAQLSLVRGEVFDLVYLVPESVVLWEMLQVLENEVEKSAKAVRAAGGDGLLHSPGLEFSFHGTPVKLLLANNTDVSEISPETNNSRVSALIARLVSRAILDAVPDTSLFLRLLTCVRLWAKQRGIYGQSHDFGYIGGMGWAICCAHVCQARPQSKSLEQIVISFFEIMSRWDDRFPLALGRSHSQVKVAMGGAYKVMLPVGENLSATPNLSASATRQLQKEFRRGNRICTKIQNGAADWNQIFASSRFFERHFHFLQIDITAASDAIMNQWLLWCRRHLQGVAEKLEAVRTCQLHTRPWPVWVPFKDPDWHVAKTLFIALRIEPQKSQTGAKPVIDLREVLVTILEKLCEWPYATKYIGEFDLYIRHMSQTEVMSWLSTVEQGLPVKRQTVSANESLNSLSADL